MITHESLGRDLSRLFVWYPVRWLASILPLRRAMLLFDMLGDIHARLSRGKSRRVAESIAKVRPAPAGASPKQFFRAFYRSQMVAFLFPRLDVRNITLIHTFANLEKLDSLKALGKGVILIHGHIGPVHIPLFHLSLLGYGPKQIGYLRKPQGLSWIGEHVAFRLRARLEAIIPAEIINADEFVRDVYRHLKGGGILLSTGDGAGRGDYLGKQAEFDYLGTKRVFPIGAAKLARRTGALLVPMYTVHGTVRGTFVTHIDDPIDTSGDDDVAITAEFVRRFNERVLPAPCEWHYFDEL